MTICTSAQSNLSTVAETRETKIVEKKQCQKVSMSTFILSLKIEINDPKIGTTHTSPTERLLMLIARIDEDENENSFSPFDLSIIINLSIHQLL